MHDEIRVVEQHPLGLAVSLDMQRIQTGSFQPKLYLVRDRLDLAWVGAAADDEVIRECPRTFFKFENREFFGFLVLAGGDGFRYLALGFVCWHAIVGR